MTVKTTEYWQDFGILFSVFAIPPLIAFTYSLGYLSSIDPDLFTLFSINDHLTFAIAHAPLLIVELILLFIIVGSIALNFGSTVSSFQTLKKYKIAAVGSFIVLVSLIFIIFYIREHEAQLKRPLIQLSTVIAMDAIILLGKPIIVNIIKDSKYYSELIYKMSLIFIFLSVIYGAAVFNLIIEGRIKGHTLNYNIVCQMRDGKCLRVKLQGENWTLLRFEDQFFIAESTSLNLSIVNSKH